MNNGTVKWFDERLGHGVITSANGGDEVPFLASAFLSECLAKLSAGQPVRFDAELDPHNPEQLRAKNITVFC